MSKNREIEAKVALDQASYELSSLPTRSRATSNRATTILTPRTSS